MNIRTFNGITLCSLALTMAIGIPQAHAIAPLTLTLDQTAKTILSGETFVFSGTVANTSLYGTELYFGGDTLNPIGTWPAGLTLDDTPFLANAPSILDPAMPYMGDLFTVTAAPGTPQGTYDGTYQVEYDDVNGNPFLSSQGFEVNIGPATAPVPETSTMVSFSLLIALGIVGAVITARKKAAMTA